MAQQNNERDNRNDNNVTSYGYISKNESTETCLAVRYWGQTCSLGIHLPDKTSNKNYMTFNYKDGAICYIRAKDCKTIYKKGIKVLEKYEETGTFEGFAIGLKNALIEFDTARNFKKKLQNLTGEINPDDICVAIYVDLKNDKSTDKYLVHVFNKDKTIKGYDPNSGGYSVETINTEFEYFLDAMNDFAKAMTKGYSHVTTQENSYSRKKFENLAIGLATALGVDLSKPAVIDKPKGNSNWNNTGTIANSSTTYKSPEVVDATDEDIERMLQELESEEE